MNSYIKSLEEWKDVPFEYRTCFGFCLTAIRVIKYTPEAATCTGGKPPNLFLALRIHVTDFSLHVRSS